MAQMSYRSSHKPYGQASTFMYIFRLISIDLQSSRLLNSPTLQRLQGVCVFLSSNYRCIRVFKLLVHLGIRARSAILPRGLYYRNLLLLEGPSYLCATAFYKVSVEFPLGYREIFKVE